MKQYLVNFLDYSEPAFLCWADDIAHAVEQANNAYPNTFVYKVFRLELVWSSDDLNLVPINSPNASWNLPK